MILSFMSLIILCGIARWEQLGRRESDVLEFRRQTVNCLRTLINSRPLTLLVLLLGRKDLARRTGMKMPSGRSGER